MKLIQSFKFFSLIIFLLIVDWLNRSLGINNLTGPVPREMGNLTKLLSLYVYVCNVSDAVSISVVLDYGDQFLSSSSLKFKTLLILLKCFYVTEVLVQMVLLESYQESLENWPPYSSCKLYNNFEVTVLFLFFFLWLYLVVYLMICIFFFFQVHW